MTGLSETIYRTRRDLIELKIASRRMMTLLGAAEVTTGEVHTMLEEES